ncbi:MAG: GNAT family N-acetyltransferase [Lachnospiraceae bacterium]|nr:GNAT family N-acetyltransferase [Lachnospiraceae bacterium]
MKFTWEDYSATYKDIVETWLDEEAKKFTGCDDGFEEYYNYWINDVDTKLSENFWAKVIIQDNIPVGVMTIALWENVFTISEYIIRPDYRGKGIGSSALAELLAESKMILGIEISDACAVIYPNNVPSQKAFEKAGFQFESEHPDGDAWNYKYRKR